MAFSSYFCLFIHLPYLILHSFIHSFIILCFILYFNHSIFKIHYIYIYIYNFSVYHRDEFLLSMLQFYNKVIFYTYHNHMHLIHYSKCVNPFKWEILSLHTSFQLLLAHNNNRVVCMIYYWAFYYLIKENMAI